MRPSAGVATRVARTDGPQLWEMLLPELREATLEQLSDAENPYEAFRAFCLPNKAQLAICDSDPGRLLIYEALLRYEGWYGFYLRLDSVEKEMGMPGKWITPELVYGYVKAVATHLRETGHHPHEVYAWLSPGEDDDGDNYRSIVATRFLPWPDSVRSEAAGADSLATHRYMREQFLDRAVPEPLGDVVFLARMHQLGWRMQYDCGLGPAQLLELLQDDELRPEARANLLALKSTTEKIEADAFGECHVLNVARLPPGLKHLGRYAFGSCSDLVLKEGLPSGLETISEDAFFNCSNLKFRSLPHGLRTIGLDAFTGCRALVLEEGLPHTLTYLGPGAFRQCRELTLEGWRPDSIKTMAEQALVPSRGAFANCRRLAEHVREALKIHAPHTLEDE